MGMSQITDSFAHYHFMDLRTYNYLYDYNTTQSRKLNIFKNFIVVVIVRSTFLNSKLYFRFCRFGL
jgi:hypothetical protein